MPTTADHELLRPCPGCGSRAGSALLQLRFRVFDDCPICGDNTWVTCRRCGLSFYDTPSDQAAFDRYYALNAYTCSTATAGTGGDDGVDRQRFEALAELLLPHVPDGGAVFDIGCGKGGLLSALARRGLDRLYGVDPVPDCIEHLRGLGLAGAVGSALQLPFGEVRPHLLVYSHILEHALDLRPLLAEADRRLADDGVVYVEVPDASRYGEFNTVPYVDLYLEHVNHFGASELDGLMAGAGFGKLAGGRTVIDPAGALPAPCIHGLYRRGPGPPEPGPPDRSLRSALEAYVERCEQHPLMGRLRELADRGRAVSLWGLSQHAMLLLGQSPLKDCRLRALVDRDPSKQRRTLGGLPIQAPEILATSSANDVVVIAAERYRQAIAAELDSMDYRGSIVTLS